MNNGSFCFSPLFFLFFTSNNQTRLIRIVLSNVIHVRRVIRRRLRILLRFSFIKQRRDVTAQIRASNLFIFIRRMSNYGRQISVRHVSRFLRSKRHLVIRVSKTPPQIPSRSRTIFFLNNSMRIVSLMFRNRISFLVSFKLTSCFFRSASRRFLNKGVIRLITYRPFSIVRPFTTFIRRSRRGRSCKPRNRDCSNGRGNGINGIIRNEFSFNSTCGIEGVGSEYGVSR